MDHPPYRLDGDAACSRTRVSRETRGRLGPSPGRVQDTDSARPRWSLAESVMRSGTRFTCHL